MALDIAPSDFLLLPIPCTQSLSLPACGPHYSKSQAEESKAISFPFSLFSTVRNKTVVLRDSSLSERLEGTSVSPGGSGYFSRGFKSGSSFWEHLHPTCHGTIAAQLAWWSPHSSVGLPSSLPHIACFGPGRMRCVALPLHLISLLQF